MSLNPIPLTLHIGYPRTATTLLQQQLEFNNPHILFLGRRTQKTERWADEKVEALWEWIRYGKQALSMNESRSHIEHTLNTAAAEGAKAAVISDETLCKSHRVDWYGNLTERLYSWNQVIEVVQPVDHRGNRLHELVALIFHVRLEERFQTRIELKQFGVE